VKIRILKTCILPDGITAVQGQVFDNFPDYDAVALIAQWKAETYLPLSQHLEIPAVIESREPEPAHRDPIPAKKRGRPRKNPIQTP
jgi:hypothetical protein